MKTASLIIFVWLLCSSYVYAQTAPQTAAYSIEVVNSWDKAQTDAPIVIKLSELKSRFRIQSAVVKDGDVEIASQLDDLNGDSKADELVFVIDMPANGRKVLSVTFSADKTAKVYPARVFATMLVRDAGKQKHAPVQSVTAPGTTDFYNMLYGHGPMFESELAAYRIYFNPKQTVDPYGKFKKGLELEESRFYPTDEQLAHGFGNDVLMVGNSCGIGTLKGWDGTKATHIEPVTFRTERILAYGPVRTITDVEVKGWQYQGKELTMTNRYILYAGHRDLLVETFFDQPLEEETFCTGVQNIMGGETLSYSDHKGLIGSWGRYWPMTDTAKYAKETIGIATYVPQKYIREEVTDKDNFLYTLSAPGSNRFHHYTMFASCKETFGYPTPEAWFAYMQEWKEALEHPVSISPLVFVPKESANIP